MSFLSQLAAGIREFFASLESSFIPKHIIIDEPEKPVHVDLEAQRIEREVELARQRAMSGEAMPVLSVEQRNAHLRRMARNDW